MCIYFHHPKPIRLNRCQQNFYREGFLVGNLKRSACARGSHAHEVFSALKNASQEDQLCYFPGKCWVLSTDLGTPYAVLCCLGNHTEKEGVAQMLPCVNIVQCMSCMTHNQSPWTPGHSGGRESGCRASINKRKGRLTRLAFFYWRNSLFIPTFLDFRLFEGRQKEETGTFV